MQNYIWILEVLIDTIRFAENNSLPKTAEALHKAYQDISRELAEALPDDSKRKQLSNIVLLPSSAVARH